MGRRQRRSEGSAGFLAVRHRTLAVREAAESTPNLDDARAQVTMEIVWGPTDAEIIRAMAADDDPGPLIE